MKNNPVRSAFMAIFVLSLTFSFLPSSQLTLAAWPEPVRGKHAMVATQQELASKILVVVVKSG